MHPDDIVFIKVIIAFILVAGTGMSAFWLWLRHRHKSPPELDKIMSAVREENAALQAELETRMVELEGRVDFVERRLVQAPKGEPLPNRRITTPV